jgi:hypothetical protein
LDSLFKEYGNPTILLDGVISSGQFSAWVDAHEENKNEQTIWEMYLHKLSKYDERSFTEFKNDMTKGMTKKVEKPSDEQLSATVTKSYAILNDLEILEERG